MAGKAAKSSSSSPSSNPKRSFVVFSALAGSLTVTALVLHVLSPPPVRAQVQGTILMSEPIEGVTARLDNPVGRDWKSIYIHHSKAAYADARSASADDELGDHFVIANGSGAGDGDLLIGYRWKKQFSAGAPIQGAKIDADCISVCLAGDFDRTKPTAAQMRRLVELVNSLQVKHNIPATKIFTARHSSAAGVGKHFPLEQFRKQIKP